MFDNVDADDLLQCTCDACEEYGLNSGSKQFTMCHESTAMICESLLFTYVRGRSEGGRRIRDERKECMARSLDATSFAARSSLPEDVRWFRRWRADWSQVVICSRLGVVVETALGAAEEGGLEV
jgi:hypothetical protein